MNTVPHAAPELCACFPGTCRGGQIINGKTVTGQRCKAQTPAHAGQYVIDVQQLAAISGAGLAQAEYAYKLQERVFEDALHLLRVWGFNGPSPIDMILHCPVCGAQHIDAPTTDIPGEVMREGKAVKVPCVIKANDPNAWTNPPHRSHLCHECGHIWRPADVPTNGVAEIRTKGKNDSPKTMPRDDAEHAEGHKNSLYMVAYDDHGKKVVTHARSTFDPVEDHRIMSSALELAQAITLRGVQISEANFYDLVIYGRKRQEQPDMAAERLPDEPAEFTAWWAREYAANSKVFHGSRAGYLKAWLAGSSGARNLLNDLHELMGYVEDGSSTTLRLHQDDATKTFIINVGPRQYYGGSIGAAIEQAIKAERS